MSSLQYPCRVIWWCALWVTTPRVSTPCTPTRLGHRSLHFRLPDQEWWPSVEVAGVALLLASPLACGVRELPQNCPPMEGPAQTFPASWCPGVVDFGSRWLRECGRRVLEGGPCSSVRWEAAPGRLAVLLCCVFYWPTISTSCSPLIIHRSCFLSPQYLGCFPASPPTGENP